VVLVVSAVSMVAIDRGGSTRIDPVFSVLTRATPPFVPSGDLVTSWFCPGVPRSADGQGGEAVIANPTDQPLSAQVTIYTDAAGVAAVSQRVEVAPRSSTSVDLAAAQPAGTFASALVEIAGGGAFVEQIARHPAGDSVGACSISTSDAWYLADGFTVEGSTESLVITNPFPDDAVVSLAVFTQQEGAQTRPRLQGLPVPGRSILVVDQALLPRDEVVLGVQLQASRGRVVLGRSQQYLGAGRLGYSMTLASPSIGNQYYFAGGESGQGVIQRYSFLNPSDVDVSVSVFFYGDANAVATADETVEVPRRSIVTFTADELFTLPDGPYGVNFSSLTQTPDGFAPFYVERASTRPVDGNDVATSVVMGMPGEFAARRWSMAIGSATALQGAIRVINVDGTPASVTLLAVGPGGEVPVSGAENLPIAASGLVSIDLAGLALNSPLIVTSTGRVFVERVLDRGDGGRVSATALPG
jgi:hypothetical protein